MSPDELETLLRAWGRAYGERPANDGEERPGPSAYGTNPIATAMQFAPGRKQDVIKQRTNMDRGGQARRRLMAVGAGGQYRVLPAAFVDSIPCRETRTSKIGDRDWPVPTEIQRVQRAALDLHAIDTMRGICLRVHYCSYGDLSDKANAATQQLGSPVKVRGYRDAVREAKFWMLGRLAA